MTSDPQWRVRFPDGSFVTCERDFYGIGSRHFTPDEIFDKRGPVPLGFSCHMNAFNLASWVGHGARPERIP